MNRVPAERVRRRNDREIRTEGDYVLYWMIAARRAHWNYGLQRALEWAEELQKPLLVLEALRCDYRWASDRLHRFVLDGMSDNQRAFGERGITYLPYVEPERGAGRGLLKALSRAAAVVVTDDFPCFFLPRMVRAAADQIEAPLESVDGNGVLPLKASAGKVFPTAFAFRRFLQKTLPEHLLERPHADPAGDAGYARGARVPEEIATRWPVASEELLRGTSAALARLPIDHGVPVVDRAGGERAARADLATFLGDGLARYAEDRTDLDRRPTTGLSAALHFGHVSSHEIVAGVLESEGWSPDRLSDVTNGARAGWWGLSGPAESFLDQVITWRELGYNMAAYRPDFTDYESLPDWARTTLREHERDPRTYDYSLEQLETAETHDELWNAAQRELLTEGIIHNYLRMLWGKKILKWTPNARTALESMIELNNRYALDGRNPNSYSGIFWVLGRYDRAWGPERPIFGKIRYMTSGNTAKKIKVAGYLARFRGRDLFSA